FLCWRGMRGKVGAKESPPLPLHRKGTMNKRLTAPPNGLRHFKSDLLSSVVVFLVALPLCLAIPAASGVDRPALGLLTGILGGRVVGALAGSPLQVGGPAAGLTVVVAGIVAKMGLPMLGVVLLGAGALQLLAGVLRLGQWFRAVSPAVVEGMLAGIGVLIFASQVHVMVDDKPRASGIQNILSIPEAVQKGVTARIETTHDEAALLRLVTIAVLVGWRVLAPKKLQMLPAPLLAIVLATAVAWWLSWPIARIVIPDNLATEVRWPTWASLQRLTEGPVLTAVFTV